MVVIGWSILLLICGINYWAMQAGEDRYRFLHNAASVCGALGLVSLAVLALAYVDAFFQVWVKRPGYEGWPLIGAAIATVLFTCLSLILAVAIMLKDRRDTRQ